MILDVQAYIERFQNQNIALNTKLFYSGNFHPWWFEILLFFQQLLFFDEVNILISSHSRSSFLSLPWCICNLLHFKQNVRLLLIFHFWFLQHFLKVLFIVFLCFQLVQYVKNSTHNSVDEIKMSFTFFGSDFPKLLLLILTDW